MRHLRVASSARWLAQDFADASGSAVVVHHDLGLDLPASLPSSTLWWAPTSYAARLAASGVHVPFQAPPADFLAHVDGALLGRRVAFGTMASPPKLTGPVHAKIADAKVTDLPAQVWPDAAAFYEAARKASIPEQSVIALSDVVTFTSEVRCFMLADRVAAASVYLSGGLTWDGLDARDCQAPAAAVEHAHDVAQSLQSVPAGWVLDVGLTTEGHWRAVEANPAWSSNPYHCDLRAVLEVIDAAQRPGRHLWRPDPATLRGRALRPLPRVERATSWQLVAAA